jgi:hypothetical protein
MVTDVNWVHVALNHVHHRRLVLEVLNIQVMLPRELGGPAYLNRTGANPKLRDEEKWFLLFQHKLVTYHH